MTQILKKYITIDEDILGGSPVITGTRIPIERLRELVKQGYTTQDLREEYPQVVVKKIQFLNWQKLLVYIILTFEYLQMFLK